MPLLMSANTFYLLSLRQINMNTESTPLMSSGGGSCIDVIKLILGKNCSYQSKPEWNCFSFWSSSQLPFPHPPFSHTSTLPPQFC